MRRTSWAVMGRNVWIRGAERVAEKLRLYARKQTKVTKALSLYELINDPPQIVV